MQPCTRSPDVLEHIQYTGDVTIDNCNIIMDSMFESCIMEGCVGELPYDLNGLQTQHAANNL